MIKVKKIKVNSKLFNFINNEVLIDLNVSKEEFWKGFSNIVDYFFPKNLELLNKRNQIQNNLNKFFKEQKGSEVKIEKYKRYLYDIGYLTKEGKSFKINTKNVDTEIANISGPQLVVPITNARYALNAVNARWGSLYDALYGANILGPIPKNSKYNKKRGDKVIDYSRNHLDNFAPLKKSSWKNIIKIKIIGDKLIFELDDGTKTTLKKINQIVGLKYDHLKNINELILSKHHLHCRIIIDPNHKIGKIDKANIADVILESAISTILDCEDSVATVDTEDKILAYRNWLGLMKGNLNSIFYKGNKKIKRILNKDIEILSLSGKKKILRGRALMLVRNVGHLMTTPAITDLKNNEIGEGIMDAIITSLIAMHDFKKPKKQRNSINKSIYIVKPKLHGPLEVDFTIKLFSHIEKLLKLSKNTIKIGIMDEERRTSVNLKECIRASKSRIAFINTGFLDRTGDEIHTSMYAGTFVRKKDMKNATWIKSYENRNVNIGLECGLQGKAQIGKGMWAMPDLMKEMLEEKINHPMSGANCAWVPSPTAATLHVMHYHKINVEKQQNYIKEKKSKNELDELLTLPLLKGKNLSEGEIKNELENNIQGILGYVVRWIDQGIGCSKVKDINNIGLMEDRATCRISSQAITNWLTHGIITKEQIKKTLKKMAKVVDKQNKNDPNYMNMSKSYDTIAFQAAERLALEGLEQPSGYTEPILHEMRIKFKSLKN